MISPDITKKWLAVSGLLDLIGREMPYREKEETTVMMRRELSLWLPFMDLLEGFGQDKDIQQHLARNGVNPVPAMASVQEAKVYFEIVNRHLSKTETISTRNRELYIRYTNNLYASLKNALDKVKPKTKGQLIIDYAVNMITAMLIALSTIRREQY